ACGSAAVRGSRPAGSPRRSRSARCRPSSGSRAPGGSSRRTRRCGRSKVSSDPGPARQAESGIRRRGDRLALRLGWPVADTALRRAAARDARSGRVRREAGGLEPGRFRLRAREVAAAVLAVSPELVAKHARSNPNTFHAPNGVDARTFAGPPAPASPGRARPAGRRIGFVGILSRHIDFVLLEKIAGAFADDQLVIGGPVLRGASAPIGEQKAALARLRRMTNVQLLGFVEPALVPELVQSFAVGIIPFVPNDFNAGRDPIKFYHYLAHGKPVVTSPVAVAREHARL